MQPYIKLSQTRVVLHSSSDLLHGRAWLGLIVLLASELVPLRTDRPRLGLLILPKRRGAGMMTRTGYRVLAPLAGLLAASLSLLVVGRAQTARFVGFPGAR